MAQQGFDRILERGETETVEFVSGEDWDKEFEHLLQTVCAFANTKGGTIYIGVREHSGATFEPIGVSDIAYNNVIKLSKQSEKYFGEPVPYMMVTNQKLLPRFTFTVMSIEPKYNPTVQITLSDGSIWKREGSRNIKIHEVKVKDGIAMSGEPIPPPRKASSPQAPHPDQIQGKSKRSGPPISTQSISENEGSGDDDEPETQYILPEGIPAPGEESPSDESQDSTSENSGSRSGGNVGNDGGFEENGNNDGDESDETGASPFQPGNDEIFNRESTSEELALKVEEHAKIIADILHDAEDSEKMSFALFGHWGRGKTFLMNEVRKQLEQKEKKYAIVDYSAWKYRTTPECWAYLYERFLENTKQDRWWIPYWAEIKKNGFWKFWISILMLFVFIGISLIPVWDKIHFIGWLLGTLGIGTLAKVLLVYLQVSRTVSKLKSSYSISRHADKLGLQAAIGNDLKYLLCAWMVKPDLRQTKIDRFRGDSNERCLLIVDDLDRCEPQQMLEIIESTMLILDDEEINSRLQVVMLIDEVALEDAILQKYDYLLPMSGGSSSQRKSIIRENLEKFFLLHLRLGELSQEDISEVVEKFVTSHTKQTTDEPEVKMSVSTEEKSPVPLSEPSVTEVEAEDTIEEPESDSVKIILDDDEAKLIMEAIAKYSGQKGAFRIGPRSIRCILMRYFLARKILRLYSFEGISLLPDAIVQAYMNDTKSLEVPLKTVVEQVI